MMYAFNNFLTLIEHYVKFINFTLLTSTFYWLMGVKLLRTLPLHTLQKHKINRHLESKD